MRLDAAPSAQNYPRQTLTSSYTVVSESRDTDGARVVSALALTPDT